MVIEVKFMKRGQIIKLVIICSIIFSFFSLSGCILYRESNPEYDEEDWRSWPINQSSEETKSGYSIENSDEIVRFNITDYYVTKVIIELAWEDEPSKFFRGTNEPDYFNFTVYTSWGEVYYSELNSSYVREEIEISEANIVNSSAYGEWTVNIYCGECGDDSESFGIRTIPDTGNEWDLTYYYEYHSSN